VGLITVLFTWPVSLVSEKIMHNKHVHTVPYGSFSKRYVLTAVNVSYGIVGIVPYPAICRQ
jgi:hypothetical protein